MQNVRSLALIAGFSLSTISLPLVGCEKQPPAPAKSGTDASAPTSAKHDDHDHDHDHDDAHDHGPATQLGEQAAEGFTIKAARSGEIKAGGHAAIDAWITAAGTKAAAVRVWVGTQDAKGSMKAKAELLTDRWHADVEVPSPLPDGGKLWVEIETDKGAKVVVGFELKS